MVDRWVDSRRRFRIFFPLPYPTHWTVSTSAAILFICMPKNVNHLNFSAANGQYGTGADDLRQLRYSLFLQIEFFCCLCLSYGNAEKTTKLIYFLHVYLLMALSLSIIQRKKKREKMAGRKCGAVLNWTSFFEWGGGARIDVAMEKERKWIMDWVCACE